jgi:hypothetical protein
MVSATLVSESTLEPWPGSKESRCKIFQIAARSSGASFEFMQGRMEVFCAIEAEVHFLSWTLNVSRMPVFGPKLLLLTSLTLPITFPRVQT